MPRIAVLPDAIADQIAAGEVVERPASVVKELVENAIDAGATTIEVFIEEGGRALIRVSDDGCGMEREDALLSLDRHATSKIRDAADLVGVRSFGFRGEALPAICSVSHLEIDTATDDAPGTLVRASGGRREAVEQGARRRGTTVSVAQLFFNTPARQKFLRGARSEWRAISDAVIALALTRRAVRLHVTHDGRPAFVLPPAETMRDRVSAIWGPAFADALVDVEDVHGATQVSGLAQRPSDVGTAGRRVHVAINGRAVRDHGIVRAAEAAYRSTLPAGVRPSLFLEIVLPAGDVDVNVHPAKAEVRFRDRWSLERTVENAIRRALGTTGSEASLEPRRWFMAPTPISAAMSSPQGSEMSLEPQGRIVAALAALAAEPSLEGGLWEGHERESEQVRLLQMRRTYIVHERPDGLVFIDQHSAHERILYERFLRQMESGSFPSQRLLFPLTMHLGAAEAEAFDAHRDLFERLGFEIEGFGGQTLVVQSVPMPHPRFDAGRCIRETLDALTGDRAPATASRHERLAATVACKAAIKAGDTLSPEEMRALYEALQTTSLPAHDVHGRSGVVQLSWDELARRFGRR